MLGEIMPPCTPHAGRLVNGERKRSLTEELLRDESLGAARKKRYSRMQAEHEYWAGKKGRKTERPRIKKKPRRSRH